MSEYPYYDFLAVDRALSITEMERLRANSSRAEMAPFGFVNEYDWGDLKADPRDLMRNFFDAYVYLANWGMQFLCCAYLKKLSIRRYWMLRLAPLRIELLCGDMRSLYIGWLTSSPA